MKYLLPFLLGMALVFAFQSMGWTHDPAHPELNNWMMTLRSVKGPCCSDDDGTAVSDPNWKIEDKTEKNGNYTAHYQYAVMIDGQWIDVPDDAVVHEQSKVSYAIVWPVRGYLGISIRCFLPGAGG